MLNKNMTRIAGILIAITINLSLVMGAANFEVNSFSCTPSENAITDVFSCTAQIKNTGDAAGSVSTATLYPDSSWLENSNYPQSSGTSVSPGQTTEVTFIGIRSIKSGSNGFSKITLDSVADTSTAVTGTKVNIIDVVVTVTNSASSAVMGATVDSSAEVTAGGNIDVILTLVVSSGGCSIGNSQTSSKTISGMQNGNKQSRTWTITQGTTTGDCVFTISAAATGTGKLASKTDSTTSTIACPNCPVASTSTTTSSSGGGGSGGTVVATVELNKSVMQELAKGEALKFRFAGVNHTLSVLNLTATTAEVLIKSTEKRLNFTVGDEKNIDLDDDNKDEISVRLKSINIITNKALFVVTPLYIPTAEDIKNKQKTSEGDNTNQISEGNQNNEAKGKSSILWIIIILVVIIAIICYIKWLRNKESKFQNTVKLKHFTTSKY